MSLERRQRRGAFVPKIAPGAGLGEHGGVRRPSSKSIPAVGRFGRFTLLRKLGAGGMGEVWLALRPGEGRQKCVVKKMLPHLAEDPSYVERFLDEARILVQLSHPNIAQTYEMGELDGEFFIAMEYVEGVPLNQLAARLREQGRQMPLALSLLIGLRACDALEYAHHKADSAGRPLRIVHRDISPANLLISRTGEVKVIDFGACQSALADSRTAPRVVLGNLAYMSPEQARKRPVDGRADLYSLCVVLWELLSWQPLPRAGESAERWRRAAFPTFVSPSRHRPEITPELDSIIMRGLAPDPRDRPQRAEQLRQELEKVFAGLGSAPSEPELAALVAELYPEGGDLHPPPAAPPSPQDATAPARLGDDEPLAAANSSSSTVQESLPAAVKHTTEPAPLPGPPVAEEEDEVDGGTLRDNEVPAARKRDPGDYELADASGPSTMPDPPESWWESRWAVLGLVALVALMLALVVGRLVLGIGAPPPGAP